MAYRDEPEYIDDEEYFDPDESSAKGRKSRNVLGASGSRLAGERSSDPAESSLASDPDIVEPKGNRSAFPRRQNKSSKPSSSKVAPAFNKPDNRSRESRPNSVASGPEHTDKAKAGDDKKRRFFNLRGRFRRGESKKPSASALTAKKTARFALVARGLGKMRGRLRSRGSSQDNKKTRRSDQSGNPASASATKQSIRAAFGASRGETRGTRKTIPAANTRQEASGRAGDRKKAPGNQRPSKAPLFKKNDWLDLDRKLDLIGVALVFGAIVLFFSALSREQAAISAFNTLIGQLLGWGALAVPVTMFAVGMWLIIRHFGDQAPTVDPIRLGGVVIAFLGILILFQFLESLSYADFVAAVGRCQEECVRVLAENSYRSGRGGGYVGAWTYLALVNSLTEVGGFIVVLMVLTFAAMMTTRMSMAEIAVVAIGFARGIRSTLAQQAAARRARRLQAEQQMALQGQETHLHVSKPAPATLPGSVYMAPALPQPTGATMPIPLRLRDLLSRRRDQSADGELEPAELEAETRDAMHGPGKGLFGRLFNRGTGEELASAAASQSLRPTSKPGAPETATPTSRGFSRPAKAKQSWRVIPRPQFNPDWRQTPPKTVPERSPAFPSNGEPSPAPAPAPVRDHADIAPSLVPSISVPEYEDPDDGEIVDDIKHTKTPAINEPSQEMAAESDAAVSDECIELEPTPELTETVDEDEALPDQVMIEAAKRFGPPAEDETPKPAPEEKAKPISTGPVNQTRPRIDWQLPDYRELLAAGSTGEMDEEVLLHHAQIIEDTLASFGAPGRVVELNTGPVITQFGVEPDYLTSRTGKRSRVKVSAIAQLDKDLQLALGAKSIRIEAPVPGKGYVGIEVPNPESAMVSLRDVMESRGFQRIDSPLAIALGKSVDGAPVSADLSQMPHLLIAGTTGSGKSKCINAIIISMLANCTPDEVKFIMVDPKRVELTGYNGLPHLVSPVVVELERIVGVLRWVTREMDERYKKFSQAGARNIIDYNSILEPDTAPMSYIVVIIDELADLMMMAPDETERSISRIAALARATGIHLVIATQRPSVDVVTGLIKANFPARIAFAVAGSVDSRVILDQPGAERLLGKGDMLYLSGDAPAPLRMQGVFVSDEETNIINRFWKMQNYGLEAVKPIDMPAVPLGKSLPSAGNPGTAVSGQQGQQAFWEMSSQRDLSGMAVEDKTGNPDPQEDELYQTAVDMVRRLEKASISLLQRRLRIGYTRAARLVDMMEERGVVGPPKEGSSKPRDVLPET